MCDRQQPSSLASADVASEKAAVPERLKMLLCGPLEASRVGRETLARRAEPFRHRDLWLPCVLPCIASITIPLYASSFQQYHHARYEIAQTTIPRSVGLSSTMSTSYAHVGFTAGRRRGDPYGRHFVSRAKSAAPFALFPTSSFDLLRSQWVPLVSTESVTLPRLEVRPSKGRGLGVFALDRIPAYTRLLEDYSLLSMAHGEDLPQLWVKYLALPDEDRRTFDALSPPNHQLDKEATMISKLCTRGYGKEQAAKMARVSSRFQGNAFNSGMNAGDWTYGYVLFPNVARVNHSCTPNAHPHYRGSSGAQYLYSLRDIEPGEEIEISYLKVTAPRLERVHRAQSWSFACQCPACSGDLGPDYEAQLTTVRNLSQVRGNLQYHPGHVGRVEKAIAIAESDDRPWLRVALPHLYANLAAARSEAGHGRAAALEAAHLAALWQDRITGPDSPESYFLKRDLHKTEDLNTAILDEV